MENSVYHDNSKESVELCLSLPNSDGVEVDVQMDSQGELWLYHDEFLDNISSVDGCVSEKTTSQLEQSFYKTLKKEKLVKLSQILPLINENQKLFLDVKNRNACSNAIINFTQFQEGLFNILGNNNSNVYVILSDSNWLVDLSTIYQVYYSTDNFSEGFNILTEKPNVRGLVIRNKAIEKSQIEAIKNLNKEVYLYDIRSPKGNRVAFSKHPSGIITDDIRAALVDR
ncbi:MAG: hypothetical protein FJZ67_01675 [Bacteroidetes bacterium]|nr:hypothetical protein [Bacteroidota bacterium]